MGRYVGPKHKLTRRFAENFGGYTKTPLARKPHKPGQHGPNMRRRKVSTFGKGLEEKQRLKAYYNIREATLLRYYGEASRMMGNTGENLIILLERRLDNMVYRAGLALTPRCARQLVAHGHVEVNGKKVDRASYIVSPGDDISVREKSRNHPQIIEAIEQFKDLVGYMKRDDKKFTATLVTMPKRQDINLNIEERLIVEFLAH